MAALAALTLTLTSAMFQDEAGMFDWARTNVGHVTHASFSSKGKAVVVATDGGVIAALFTKDGGVGWRHVLADGGCPPATRA